MSAMFKLLFLQLACVTIVLANSNQTPGQTISVVTRLITLPAGYIHYPDIRAALKVHEEKADNWSAAKEACVAEGARLAVIDTREKLAHVSLRKSLWVGIKKKNSKWITADTNAQLSNLPWGSDQPEGVGDCVAVQKDGRGLYNRLCVWSQRFICEIPIETTLYQAPCN